MGILYDDNHDQPILAAWARGYCLPDIIQQTLDEDREPREKAQAMEAADPFCIMDCSLVRYATGRSCSNLRELLEAIRSVPDAVLEHHMGALRLGGPLRAARVSE